MDDENIKKAKQAASMALLQSKAKEFQEKTIALQNKIYQGTVQGISITMKGSHEVIEVRIDQSFYETSGKRDDGDRHHALPDKPPRRHRHGRRTAAEGRSKPAYGDREEQWSLLRPSSRSPMPTRSFPESGRRQRERLAYATFADEPRGSGTFHPSHPGFHG